MAIEAAVQLLRRCGKMVQSHLLPGNAPAALRVHAVPTALLITWDGRWRQETRSVLLKKMTSGRIAARSMQLIWSPVTH